MWLSTRRIATSEPVSVIPNASWLEYTNDTILSLKLASGEMVLLEDSTLSFPLVPQASR